jgi:hypothetical protein
MGEQMLTMNTEVIGRPSIMNDDLFQSVDQKYVKDGLWQLQNFLVNFHKFHLLFSKRLYRVGFPFASFVQDGLQKCSRLRTKLREWLRLWPLSAILQKWQWISQSRSTSNRWWNLNFVTVKLKSSQSREREREKVCVWGWGSLTLQHTICINSKKVYILPRGCTEEVGLILVINCYYSRKQH